MSNNENKDIFEELGQEIMDSDATDEQKKELTKRLLKLKSEKINLLITGGTGCGKSSTINALFNANVAKVGVGVDPETMDITKYELDNLVLWDSPGLGDGIDADKRHSKNIIKKLNELDSNGNPLIDLVLVILDGSSRDYGTSFQLINEVIIPNFDPKDKNKRILVAINQADVAMKGRYWNEKENRPEPQLEKFLEEKVVSVKNRIHEATGVNITPIYYSAGYTEEDGTRRKPYNLSKLLAFIVKYTPSEKRLSYVNNINTDKGMWESDDGLEDYRKEVQKSFSDTIFDGMASGVDIGIEIGSYFGTVGKVVGGVVGGILGVAGGFFKGIFGL